MKTIELRSLRHGANSHTPALRDTRPIYILATGQQIPTPQTIYVDRVVERILIATPTEALAPEPITPVAVEPVAAPVTVPAPQPDASADVCRRTAAG